MSYEEIKSSTPVRIGAAFTLLAGATAASALAYFNPVTDGFTPACAFHSATGLNCPGCGLTRGFHALFNGDVLTALHFNVLIPFYLFFFGYLGVSLFLTVYRGYGLNWEIFRLKYIIIFVVIATIYGIIRNLPFYPFNLLWI